MVFGIIADSWKKSMLYPSLNNGKKWLLEIRAVRYTHVIRNIICENR